ncbi:hypothetical protein NSK_003660 [Nannochloropsis salina CCMP1776]|uniref:S1 motif domain-containing protein n=1 Tax=Nannochloropsis salina CCMP1776 TaxID=1027361 RepID=A0A4D9D4C4_9STRA|nr:hypothetical protein NSK_003660 [Nannochloropsis salina CCMP1776]|eukprot:TFJ85237.1 hypothetical protein NSK_003660 [Nannochloropsis salina CCMP1776]
MASDGEESTQMARDESTRLQCRFYEEQYPNPESMVMVKVINIADMAAEVILLEYNDIEGMILHSELSRRRIRSIKKLIRVNKLEVVSVLRVDKKKGYIDLSKRRVSPDDVIKCEERYNKAKAVHSVLRHVADMHHLWLEDLCKKVAWPLYRKHGHAFDAFTKSLLPEGDDRYEDVFAGLDISPEVKHSIVTYIKRRLAPKPIKIRADIDVTCFAYEGIEAVRAALQAGLETPCSSEVEIKLIAPPMYVVTTNTLEQDIGIENLNQVIERIRARIVASEGRLEVKMEPKVVSQRDEADLQAMIKRIEEENEEVDGDAPEDA